MPSVADTIKAIRSRLGKTQGELALMLACSRNTITRYELGGVSPSRSMLLLLLQLAEGEERAPILDALGVDRKHQEGWAPGELEHELAEFESYLEAGGRAEYETKNPRREFMSLAKQLAGDTAHAVPTWLIEVLQHWIQHRGNHEAIEFFEHVPIYLDVQLRMLESRKASPKRDRRPKPRHK